MLGSEASATPLDEGPVTDAMRSHTPPSCVRDEQAAGSGAHPAVSPHHFSCLPSPAPSALTHGRQVPGSVQHFDVLQMRLQPLGADQRPEARGAAAACCCRRHRATMLVLVLDARSCCKGPVLLLLRGPSCGGAAAAVMSGLRAMSEAQAFSPGFGSSTLIRTTCQA